MSSYRTLHRYNQGDLLQDEVVGILSENSLDKSTGQQEKEPCPIFALEFSPCRLHSNRTFSSSPGSATSTADSRVYRFLTSSADGFIRSYAISEKSNQKKGDNPGMLDASALSLKLEEIMLMTSNSQYPKSQEDSILCLGSASLSVVRNYVGEDEDAGDEISAALRLDGHVALWRKEQQHRTPANLLDSQHGPSGTLEIEKDRPYIVRPLVEFYVKGTTGTTMQLQRPQLTGYSRYGIVMMVGMLDGSVLFVCTGVAIPDSRKCNEASQCSAKGTVLDRVGSGNSIPMSFAIHPFHHLIFAVGRKDGTVDIYSSGSYRNDDVYGNFNRIHRLLHHAGSAVRALSFTPDGSLLISGCDGGHIYIHDTSSLLQNGSIRLVAAILKAHGGYILSLTVLPDCKRFLTSSADRTVKIWNAGTPNNGPLHTFDGGHGDMIWNVSCASDGKRCASCSDDGYLQIYSCQ